MSLEANLRAIEERRKQMLEQERNLKINLTKIQHKIAIISGKGGVGKSTVTANLAVALATHGHVGRIGILDADIHGPSIPRMLGIEGQRLRTEDAAVYPATGPMQIKVVSMELLLPDENAPVVWRGPLKMIAIRQFLSDITWGDLDFLLIDLPPGTGDEPLSVAQLIPDMDGVVIVTIPSAVSQMVVKKAVTFAQRLGLPIIGVIENMSGFTCPHCGSKIDIFQSGGGRRVSEEMRIPYLGGIPLEEKIGEDSDKGTPFITDEPDSAPAKAFMEIVRKIEAFVQAR